jgi:SOS response regulatory protein OraA/RecX
MDTDKHKLLMKKAGALLARRAYSRGELRGRLSKLAEELSVEPVLDRLEQQNLLNDADYAYNFALCRMRQEGWGPAKVQGALLRRQVDQATIERALQLVQNELGSGAILTTCLNEYCARKGMPADLKSLRRLFFHLGQRGFAEDEIIYVLRRTVPDALWHRFETGE